MDMKTCMIGIRVSERDKKLIEEAAKKDSRSVSDYCRLVILNSIKKEEK